MGLTLAGRIYDLSDQQTLLKNFLRVSISIKKYILMCSHLDENNCVHFISYFLLFCLIINKLIQNCNIIAKKNPPPSLIRSQLQLYTSFIIHAYILDIEN